MGDAMRRRDFIHRLSSTLAALSSAYRGVDLAVGERASLEPQPFDDEATPTWVGDAFPENGELVHRRRFAERLFAEGRVDLAFDMLLGGTGTHWASEPDYRACLTALARVCLATGRSRHATTVAWYLGVAPSTLGVEPTARDLPRALLAHDARASAVAFDAHDDVSHAAHAWALAGDRPSARARWTQIGEALARSDDELGRAHRALAFFQVARNATDRTARLKVMREAVAEVVLAAQIAQRRGEHALAAHLRAISRAMTADDALDGELPRSVTPLLDADHAHDPVEICAEPLLDGASVRRRHSAHATVFIRRRALVARLLALEVSHPTRTPDDAAHLRASLARRLGAIADPRLLPALERLARDPHPTVATAALEELRHVSLVVRAA